MYDTANTEALGGDLVALLPGRFRFFRGGAAKRLRDVPACI